MSIRQDGLVALLVSGETAQRALDETLADWREARPGTRGFQRLRCDLVGVLSLARMLGALARREIAAADTLRLVGFAILASALPAVLLAAYASGPAIGGMAVAWLLVPGAMAVFLPIAAALGIGRAGDGPLLGPAIVIVVFQLAMGGWIVPAANQEYRRRAFEISQTLQQRPYPYPLPVPGLREASLGRLAVVAASDGWSKGIARREISSRLAIVAACPLFLLLGAAARRRFRHRIPARFVRFAAGVVATGVFLLIPTALRLLKLQGSPIWLNPLVSWLLPLVAAIVIVFLARRVRQTTAPYDER